MKQSKYQQSIYQDVVETEDNITISATAGCLGLDTPILMYDKSVKLVQDIIVGDKVMGPDFTSRNVLTTAQGKSQLYKIIPNTGESWICNHKHILTVYNAVTKELEDIEIEKVIHFLKNGVYIPARSKSALYQLQRNKGIRKNVPLQRCNFSIQTLKKGDWYGFSVDEDRRFLLGDYTITHNSGKTTTLIETLKLIPREDSALFLSFSNTIVNELKDRVPSYIKATTLHSQGFGIIKANTGGKIDLNNNLYFQLALELFKDKKSKESHRDAFQIQEITQFIRMTMTSLDYESITDMCIKYSLNGGIENINKAIQVMHKRNSKPNNYIDFADMIYWPATKNYNIQKFKYVMVDECFPGDTLIRTNEGKLKIKDIYQRIKNGDKTLTVCCFNQENNIFEYKPIINAWNRGIKTTIQFVVGGCRKIECTPNHKFLTTFGWKEASDLTKDDWIIAQREDRTGPHAALVSGMTKKTREVEVYDLEVQDNHNFLICGNVGSNANTRTQQIHKYELVAHNCQDLNKSQQMLIEKLIAPGGRLIAVGDKFQCQPKGTKIKMKNGSEKNIEDIEIGDKVVSYNIKAGSSFVGFDPNSRNPSIIPIVQKVAKRYFEGDLIQITANNHISRYTPEHRCMIRMREDSIGNYMLFIMQKGSEFKLESCPLWSDNHEHFGYSVAVVKKADKMWILDIGEYAKIMCLEKDINNTYGISSTSWSKQLYLESIISKKHIDTIVFGEDLILNSVNEILTRFYKHYHLPFWVKGEVSRLSKKYMSEIKACNIFSDYMQVIEFNVTDIDVSSKSAIGAIKPKYINIDQLQYIPYADEVYSLQVKKLEMYVADNLLTHNSIYGFAGSSIQSFVDIMNRPFTLIKPLSICYRCDINIVKAAQTINPLIEYNPENELGIVRYGEVDEITIDDMVICRNTAPLIITMFKLIQKGIKAYVLGREIERGLISLINFQESCNSFTQLNILLERRKDKLATELRDRGIKKVEYNSGYINLCDQIQIIQIIAKQVSSPSQIKLKIQQIFKEQEGGCRLMTIHKSKGLENNRVFIIEKFDGKILLPSPYAVSPDQLIQEENLKFVALTRAKKELITIRNVDSKF